MRQVSSQDIETFAESTFDGEILDENENVTSRSTRIVSFVPNQSTFPVARE